MKAFLKIVTYGGVGFVVLAILLIGYVYSLTFTPYGRMDWRQAAFAKFVSFNTLTEAQLSVMTTEDFRKAMPPMPLDSVGSIQSLKITADSLPVFIYKPVGFRPNSPVVIYYHGGGFFMPFNTVSDHNARQFTNRFKTIVVAVDYRTAPAFPYPTPLNDCYATFKWVLDQAKSFGGNPEKIAIIGESAGGNLSTVICQKAQQEGFGNIKYQALICPTTDAAHFNAYPSAQKFQHGYMLDKNETDFAFKSYVPHKADLANPEVSPLLAKSLAGLPPAFVITAEFDPLHDEGVAYMNRLKKEGVPVTFRDMKGCVHVIAGPGMDDITGNLYDEIATELSKAFK